jgi:hypothetical protein
MNPGLTCLVTLHGIGYGMPPLPDGTPGHADALHARLSTCLRSVAADDGISMSQSGPVYVQGSWPLDSGAGRLGLARLGAWDPGRPLITNTAGASLRDGQASIAHVALVYPHLAPADAGPRAEALLELAAMAGSSFEQYASVAGMARMVLADIRATLGPGHVASPGVKPLGSPVHAVGAPCGSGPLAWVGQLQDEVAAYVCRNDLREHTRTFVREALLRLCCRQDIGGIVVNAHSQGTVIAFDALRHLPPAAAAKIRWLVTAGSPLRKYTTLLAWGREAGSVGVVRRWINFWDRADPVADPLGPPIDWRYGVDPGEASGRMGLYCTVDLDTGAHVPLAVDDRVVNNRANSCGGGLRAHNCWDNEPEVIRPLADILGQVASGVDGSST